MTGGVAAATTVALTGVIMTAAAGTMIDEAAGAAGARVTSHAATAAAAGAQGAAADQQGAMPVMCLGTVLRQLLGTCVRAMGMPVASWTLGPVAAASAAQTRCSGWAAAVTDERCGYV